MGSLANPFPAYERCFLDSYVSTLNQLIESSNGVYDAAYTFYMCEFNLCTNRWLRTFPQGLQAREADDGWHYRLNLHPQLQQIAKNSALLFSMTLPHTTGIDSLECAYIYGLEAAEHAARDFLLIELNHEQ